MPYRRVERRDRLHAFREVLAEEHADHVEIIHHRPLDHRGGLLDLPVQVDRQHAVRATFPLPVHDELELVPAHPRPELARIQAPEVRAHLRHRVAARPRTPRAGDRHVRDGPAFLLALRQRDEIRRYDPRIEQQPRRRFPDAERRTLRRRLQLPGLGGLGVRRNHRKQNRPGQCQPTIYRAHNQIVDLVPSVLRSSKTLSQKPAPPSKHLSAFSAPPAAPLPSRRDIKENPRIPGGILQISLHGKPRPLPGSGVPSLFLSHPSAAAARFSTSRIAMCCGHTASHAPHWRHAPARLRPAPSTFQNSSPLAFSRSP